MTDVQIVTARPQSLCRVEKLARGITFFAWFTVDQTGHELVCLERGSIQVPYELHVFNVQGTQAWLTVLVVGSHQLLELFTVSCVEDLPSLSKTVDWYQTVLSTEHVETNGSVKVGVGKQ